jgi:hypothetical protein
MGCLVKADPDFGRFPFSGLALPGSRNAGAYDLDPESFDTQRGSSCTSFTANDAKLGPEFARWSQTQDETITEQLDEGIRFVDLQVTYNGNGSALTGWRVVQSLYSDVPLYDYLDQIAIWAKAHPTEAVVVDLSRVARRSRPARRLSFDRPTRSWRRTLCGSRRRLGHSSAKACS